MSRFNYKIVAADGGRFALIRELASGDVAGYDDECRRSGEARHFAIHRSHGILHAVADSRTYATREEAERVLAGLEEISAAQAFDLEVLGRAKHGGQEWIVYSDGAYRHVVEATHFNACGYRDREHDDERRADNYSEWCGRGLWAKDDVAAEVAGLCDLTHVHSAEDGTCSRVAAVEMT